MPACDGDPCTAAFNSARRSRSSAGGNHPRAQKMADLYANSANERREFHYPLRVSGTNENGRGYYESRGALTVPR